MNIRGYLLPLWLMYGTCNACHCFNEKTKAQLACDSDFVFKSNVRSGLMHKNGQHFYRIRKPRTRRIYKLNYKTLLSDASLRKVYTERDGGECGATLKQGTTYVLSGKIDKLTLKLSVHSCWSWIEAAPISDSSKAILRTLKKNGYIDCIQEIQSSQDPYAFLRTQEPV